MDLAEAIAQQKVKKGPPCTVAVLLDSLDVKQRTVLQEGLADRGLPATKLSEALELAGLTPIAANTLGRHRNRKCGCPK